MADAPTVGGNRLAASPACGRDFCDSWGWLQKEMTAIAESQVLKILVVNAAAMVPEGIVGRREVKAVRKESAAKEAQETRAIHAAGAASVRVVASLAKEWKVLPMNAAKVAPIVGTVLIVPTADLVLSARTVDPVKTAAPAPSARIADLAKIVDLVLTADPVTIVGPVKTADLAPSALTVDPVLIADPALTASLVAQALGMTVGSVAKAVLPGRMTAAIRARMIPGRPSFSVKNARSHSQHRAARVARLF